MQMMWWLWIGCAERAPLSITSTWGTLTPDGLPLTIQVQANRTVCVEDQLVWLPRRVKRDELGVIVASIANRPHTGISNIDHTVRIRLGYYPDPPYVTRVDVGDAMIGVRCMQPGERFQRTVLLHWPLSEYEIYPSIPIRCIPNPTYRIEIPWSPTAKSTVPFRTPAGESYRGHMFAALPVPQRFVISDPVPLPPELIVAQGPPCGTSYWYDAETWPTSKWKVKPKGKTTQ